MENFKYSLFSGHPGDVIAVIGSTGSGKSSFVKSLIGFRSFDYGEIICGIIHLKSMASQLTFGRFTVRKTII